jgi:ABC-2 type transport system ATP-binding protein
VIFDGPLSAMVDRFAAHKKLVVDLREPGFDLSLYGEVTGVDGLRTTLQVPKADVPRVTARLLGDLPVADLSVEEPPFDEVIERVFSVQ